MAYACKVYEQQHLIQPDVDLMIDIQSTGLESKDNNGVTHQAFLDFDSIFVHINSFQLAVNDDTLYYTLPIENHKIDLLSFVSKDTVLWKEVFIHRGRLDSKGVLEVTNEGNYVVDHQGDRHPLQLRQPFFNFELFSKMKIEEPLKYGIKLDFMHSLQVVEHDDGTYTLSQKDKGGYQNGMMFLYQLQ
ncbi:hypothetical protein AVL50_07420 [Flammeovirga sp. SJP92]|nr:hypothetical protein AVL50_07420 [Flammeovirga sp. SJP92]